VIARDSHTTLDGQKGRAQNIPRDQNSRFWPHGVPRFRTTTIPRDPSGGASAPVAAGIRWASRGPGNKRHRTPPIGAAPSYRWHHAARQRRPFARLLCSHGSARSMTTTFSPTWRHRTPAAARDTIAASRLRAVPTVGAIRRRPRQKTRHFASAPGASGMSRLACDPPLSARSLRQQGRPYLLRRHGGTRSTSWPYLSLSGREHGRAPGRGQRHRAA